MFAGLKIENRMKYIYGGFLKKPVVKNSILFESFHGKEISDSPLAMARALLSSSDREKYELYFSTDNMSRDQKFVQQIGLKVKLVDIHSREYAKALATCEYLVNNSSFPSYFIRRDGQHYMQTWHGTPLKTLGKMMPYDIETMYNVQHNFLQADWLMFPNEFTKEVIMRDYILDDLYTGRVALSGYPRNGIFSDVEAGLRVKSELGDEELTTFAYMPTWRGQSNQEVDRDEYGKEVAEMLAQLDETLDDSQKLYVNFHPIVQKDIKLDSYKHIIPFPKGVEKYEFLNSVDVLITDYSSVFFDYSITGKPIILFMYDYEEYMAERGMYFDIRELPFIKLYSMEELKKCITSESYLDCKYKEASGEDGNRGNYRDKFIQYDSIDAAERMNRILLYDDTEGIKVKDYSGNRDKEWQIAEYPDLYETADLDEIANKIRPDKDVAVFYRNTFNSKLSQHMLDNYRDAFRYVFVTKSNPMSYGEIRESRYGWNTEKFDRRNIRRCLGELNVIDYSESCTSGRILKLKASGSRLEISVKFPKKVGVIRDMSMVYRSDIEEISYPFDYNVTEREDYWILSGILDLQGLNVDGIFWDLKITAENKLGLRDLHVAFTRVQRQKILTRNIQCDLGDYILFPHITIKGKLAFTHREKTPYDTAGTRFKELIAFIYYRLFRKQLKKRHIWLVYEKFCSMAQDNGYYFFKYCMEELKPSQNKEIYYVLDKDSSDWSKVSQYGKHVVRFMSLKHMIYNMAAGIYVGADSRKHLYVWRAKPNRVSSVMRKKKTYFLQHGVTALKRVDGIFGAHGSSPMTYFCATSQYEQDIITENFGYDKDHAPITGFTRWDVLEDKSTPDEKIILVMPTWRSWLEEKTAEEFSNSDYFRQYSEFLGNRELGDYLKETDTKLIFYIHPKFKDYLGEFNVSEENIELIPFGSEPLNEIMMKCSMLVTDYSSVCWDVYYQGKPVLFFQFDYDKYMEVHGSYMDMEKELFGPRFMNCNDLIQAIKEKVESGFAEDENAKAKRMEYFAYIDNNNSKRTYEFLKKNKY